MCGCREVRQRGRFSAPCHPTSRTSATIQWIKHSSRGFRDRERFKLAIYFHCGGLDLSTPAPKIKDLSYSSPTEKPEEDFRKLLRVAATKPSICERSRRRRRGGRHAGVDTRSS